MGAVKRANYKKKKSKFPAYDPLSEHLRTILGLCLTNDPLPLSRTDSLKDWFNMRVVTSLHKLLCETRPFTREVEYYL